jgi:hypothetical protein
VELGTWLEWISWWELYETNYFGVKRINPSRDLYFGRFIYIAARFFISAAGPLRRLPRIPGVCGGSDRRDT